MSCTKLLMEVESTLYSSRSKNEYTGYQDNYKQETELINGLIRATKVVQVYITIQILWLQLSKAMILDKLDSQLSIKFAISFNDSKTI